MKGLWDTFSLFGVCVKIYLFGLFLHTKKMDFFFSNYISP